LKKTNLPPAAKAKAKASLIVGATAGSVIIQEAVKIASPSFNPENLSDGHPDSPVEGVVGQFSQSSIFSFNFSDVLIFFGVDPSNQILILIFCILSLSFIILMFLYFLTLYLIYIYLYYRYKDNLELN
jgi:hypothetical protein